jgi:DNA-binding phage protein
MEIDACIRVMVSARGLRLVDLSHRLHRADSWARTISREGRSPSLSTVVQCADALGYDLTITDRDTGETLGLIDPPHRGKRGD